MVVTFVTSSSPKSVKHLDNLRLNKQRVEAQQILDMLSNGNRNNHPSVLMWVGHADALKVYINHCIHQWLKRGKHCTLQPYTDVDESTVEWPWWFTWPLLHLSHKCSLLRKDPEYYSKQFTLSKKEQEWLQYGYIWPSKLNEIDVLHPYLPSEVCSAIGSGAPAQYRWSVEDVSKWDDDRSRNPHTGRTIKSTGGIYKDLEKAYKYYDRQGLL